MVFDDALIKSEPFKTDPCLVLGSDNWHEGVIGIAAAKMVDRFNKPVFILSLKEGIGKGSCRTIKGFNLHRALSQCTDLLEKWGGHYYACGFTIQEKNIDLLRTRLNTVFNKEQGNVNAVKMIKPHIEIELQELNEDSLKWLERMEPSGPLNELPLFFTREAILVGEPRVVGETHLKFAVSQGGHHFSAIGFGLADFAEGALEKLSWVWFQYFQSLESGNQVKTSQILKNCPPESYGVCNIF